MQSACRLCKAPIDGKRRFVAAIDLDNARGVFQSRGQILRHSWISNDAIPEQSVCFCRNRVCLLIVAFWHGILHLGSWVRENLLVAAQVSSRLTTGRMSMEIPALGLFRAACLLDVAILPCRNGFASVCTWEHPHGTGGCKDQPEHMGSSSETMWKDIRVDTRVIKFREDHTAEP
jgi:hypothetical protein